MYTMRILSQAILCAFAVKSAFGLSPLADSTRATCEVLLRKYPSITYVLGDDLYEKEDTVSWTAAAWLSPAWVFAPSKAHEPSFAVRIIKKHNVPFAMRGGGHMPIADAANINATGILLSGTNLNTIKLSSDKSILSVGSGLRWGDVYQFLDGSGLSVIGGRLAPVGVAGLILGGGVSFFSNEYGLASTNGNVLAFECVLANGSVVKATATNQHSDLFWALQGGGNSLCLATSFQLRTIDAPITMLGQPSYRGQGIKRQFIDSVYDFVINGQEDPKSSIIPVVQFESVTTSVAYSSTLFYNGNDSLPLILRDFLGRRLTPINGTEFMAPLSLGQYSRLVSPAFEEGGQSWGIRQRFHTIPMAANREAMEILHDIYIDAAQTSMSGVEGFVAGLAFNPVTTKMLSETNAKPGCLQGLDEVPQFWSELSLSWTHASDDERVDTFIRRVDAEVTARLSDLNARAAFYYLNNADDDQPVFESYPSGSLSRLQKIRSKYDPDRVFTDLMAEGFKFADVPVQA